LVGVTDDAAPAPAVTAAGDGGAFVALLRGVNVGRGNRVPMAAFRALLEAQGFEGVRTLLNSGNAVFVGPAVPAAEHAAAIRAGLRERLDVDVHVVVVPASTLGAIVTGNPWDLAADEHPRCLTAFAQDPEAVAALAALEPLLLPTERLVIGEHAAYLHCPEGIRASRAAGASLGKAGRGVTTRNWATVLKLQGLLDEVERRRLRPPSAGARVAP
jgi:uncharacterized protein (DUF1697 family)